MTRGVFRSIFAVVLVMMLAVLSGCSEDKLAGKAASAEFKDAYGKDDTWVIHWYLCGTDLESRFGAASADLAELEKVKLWRSWRR